jgi:hypothetical protein
LKKSESKYIALEQVLISKGYITQVQSDVISRRGTRKEIYWKRHILDLCSFVLEHKRIDTDVEEILNEAIQWVKT